MLWDLFSWCPSDLGYRDPQRSYEQGHTATHTAFLVISSVTRECCFPYKGVNHSETWPGKVIFITGSTHVQYALLLQVDTFGPKGYYLFILVRYDDGPWQTTAACQI